MSARQLQEAKALEGRPVAIALLGGDRIDGQLVSVGRGRASTMWVFESGSDRFVPIDDVVDVWLAA